MTPPGEILFLCHRIPFPPDRGDKIRSYHLLQALSGIAPVHVGCFADDARDLGFADPMAELTASQCVTMRDRSRVAAGLAGLFRGQPMLVSLYDKRELHNWVARTLAERPIRWVVGYSVQMAHYVPALPDGVRFVMDFVDFDSAKYAAYGAGQRGPMGWINRREGRKLFAFERAVAARADMSLFVSEAEAALFRAEAGFDNQRVRALENGVDLDFFHPSAAFIPLADEERGAGPLIVFTGQMDYRPNIEAVEHFVRDAMPSIRSVYPDACFAIVGRSPAASVQALGRMPGVRVTGAVADVRGWLAAADVVVAPLRIARGIQNKVLEAMAMGRPVIASPDAAAGIDAHDGEHFWVARDSAAEAASVLSLIAQRDLATALGRAARARMEDRYAWSAKLAGLSALLAGDGRP